MGTCHPNSLYSSESFSTNMHENISLVKSVAYKRQTFISSSSFLYQESILDTFEVRNQQEFLIVFYVDNRHLVALSKMFENKILSLFAY